MQCRHILIAALLAVAIIDAGTTQIALFLGSHESNPLQVAFTSDPLTGITVRLLGAIVVIVAIEYLAQLWHRMRQDAAKQFPALKTAPRIDLAAYSAAIVLSIPTLAGNIIAIAKVL